MFRRNPMTRRQNHFTKIPIYSRNLLFHSIQFENLKCHKYLMEFQIPTPKKSFLCILFISCSDGSFFTKLCFITALIIYLINKSYTFYCKMGRKNLIDFILHENIEKIPLHFFSKILWGN